MVKGISRQAVVVHGPEPQLFEQAIFILKDSAACVTDEMLLKEAKKIMNTPQKSRAVYGPIWACGGAALTGLIWLITILF